MTAEPVEEEPAPTPDELVCAWSLLSGATVDVSIRLAEGLDDAARLSLPAFDVLVRLWREPDHRLRVSSIAAGVGLTSGGFTKLLDRLELDGLVTRDRRPTDRSIDEAVLTNHGREVAAAALTRYAADLRRHLLAPLGARGLGELTALAKALREHHR